uniref:Uncharacterized protein n=1 Tax=Tanacetum cinerariifolium TaxID=118510 RepID=A0A6L2KNE1_TANCI|nr:hypothetical protein [Tanacetum cinerariifolium]
MFQICPKIPGKKFVDPSFEKDILAFLSYVGYATSKLSQSSGAHEGTRVTPGVPDVPTYEFDDEQISWKSSDEDDDELDEEEINEEDEGDELYRHVNVNLESKTSHAVAANLSELELKRILIDKMERSKSIHRSDEQKNHYKALVDACKFDKLILDTYVDIVMIKGCQDDHPSLDQTGGQREEGLEKNPSLLVHQRSRLPS